MSQAPPEEVSVGVSPGAGDYHYPPQSAQNKTTQGEANFIDGSGPIFSMYMEMATEEDKKMAESWKADADGILFFTGLFSAAIASLISVSIQDIQENPQDTSNFYLSNIYRGMADPNTSSSLPASPPPFSPPKYAIWVNALWFLSLVISITCALLATLLQQWARRYLKVTQPRYSPHKRARIRAFFAEGVDKFLLPWAVEALPTMLHISLFLFFAGLVVFLWNVNLTIFKLVLSWVSVCTALYGCITLVPLFHPDSPYHTPLSLPLWHLVAGIHLVTFRVLHWFAGYRFGVETFCRLRDLKERYHKMVMQGMQKAAEETVLTSLPEIDTRAFLWTFDSLDEDHELERFFSGLPGFRSSKMVEDPLPDLTAEQKEKLSGALIGLLDRTFSSDLLPEPVKIRRTVICTKAIDPADIPQAGLRVLNGIGSEDQYGPVQSAAIERLVRGWGIREDEETTSVMQALVTSVVARAQRRDDRWFSMASDELGIPETDLRTYAMHGDSLSLAILIHITRQQFSHFWEPYWPWPQFSTVLEAASKFNALDTSPDLRHEFCVLWNQIVRKMQEDGAGWIMAFHTLGRIRNVYVALHEGTDSAPTQFSASTGDEDDILWDSSTYPLCNISGHHPNWKSHIHDFSSSTPNVHPVPLDNIAPVPVFPASAPDAPSPSVPSLHVDQSLVRLHKNIPASFNRTRQTAMESHRVHPTPLDTATAAGEKRHIETPARTMPSSAPETSTSNTSVPLIGEFCLQNNVFHSGIPKTSPPASVFDDITESHCTAGSHKDKDGLGLTLVDRVVQGTMAIVNLPAHMPQLQSTPSNEIAIAAPSLREPDSGRTGSHPPQTSHDQYDIV